MYSPKYTISNQILKNIGAVEAAREVIENAPLIPAYEKKFQEEAILRTIHHGTHIEGNDLSLEQAQKVLQQAQGETQSAAVAEKAGVVARERDVQEVINYRSVLSWIDGESAGAPENFGYSESQLKQIHKIITSRLIPAENQGVYRKTQVVLKDSRTGEVTFRPPPAVEVPYLMEDFFVWLNSESSHEVHPVLRAGLAHYALAAIHPFVEGNGRTARAFATLVLFAEGYDIRRLFSLEEYFDRDAEGYYQALITTSSQSGQLAERDLTDWLAYFTHGLAAELSKIKEKVRKLSIDTKIKRKRGEQVAISERQVKIVEYLAENGEARMGELHHLFLNISDDTVLRDLQSLTRKDIIKKSGTTKGAVYTLVT